MSNSVSLLDRQFLRWELERSSGRKRDVTHPSLPELGPLITVSRQHGTPGAAVAGMLAEHLHYTLLHHDTIERMATSTGHARRLFEVLDEHARSRFTTWIESLMAGAYVDEGTYRRALLWTIYSIAEQGGVVVVGRGANFIVGLDRGFHVRIVGSRDVRIHAIMERHGLGQREATREVDHRDRERADFVQHMFHRSVEDPAGYDVTVNADAESPETITRWLAVAAREKFARHHLLHAI